jgi:2-dehydropantoate 2-reductase
MASPKVLIHGSGAIGTIYVYLLSKAGYDVTAVCRSNYEAVKSKGFLIDSDLYGKGIRFTPKVVRSPTEAAEAGPYNYVIVATKALPGAESSKVIAPAVSSGKTKTTIALVQNGVGIESEYAQAFPDNPLLSCVVYLPTTQISPGHIQMGNLERLEVGTYPTSAYNESAACKRAVDEFLSVLKHARSDVRWYEDIQVRRWNKLLINAAWNPICALTLSRDVAFLASDAGASKIVEDVMLEVVAIAQRLGYSSISPEAAIEQMKRAGSRRGGKGIEPSMLVDVLNGRRMEVDALLGNPIKIAKELGVAVPRMEMLYGLTKALDEAAALRQPGRSLGGDETSAESLKRGGSAL